MRQAELVRAAVRSGQKQADGVVRVRRARVRKRQAGDAGVLVAEGDSWFDYPGQDVLRLLEDAHGFEVESVAHRGDRVEEMAYTGQLEEFARRLEKLLRRGVVPRAILLSGGGNDIAGREFGLLLDHAASPTAGVNALVAQGIIDQRIKLAYVTILAQITRICDKVVKRRIPILAHGYDYPIPDGRGFLGGFWFLPGPWLEPGFRGKGFHKRDQNAVMMRSLIDRFNDMLLKVAALKEFKHVICLDLRGTLAAGAGYKKDWANELHPSNGGFAKVARKFAAAIP